MRTFHLDRLEDETGVSGTGTIAQGVVFDTGMVAMAWLTAVSSIAIYPDLQSVMHIHGHGGKTRLIWDQLPPPIVNVVMTGDEIDAERVVATLKAQLSQGLTGTDDLFDDEEPKSPVNPFLGGD